MLTFQGSQQYLPQQQTLIYHSSHSHIAFLVSAFHILFNLNKCAVKLKRKYKEEINVHLLCMDV